MNDRVTQLFKSDNRISSNCAEFLVDRCISIHHAKHMPICGDDNNIYFMYLIDGEIVGYKGRSLFDKKKQVTITSDVPMPFYSQFKVPSCPYLIITEGEPDCVVLHQLGALNCVSLPNGSGSVKTAFRNNYQFLQQFDVIYIAFDMDDAGNKAAEQAREMIDPLKFRRICFPCKDANDWLMEYEATMEDLEILMANAKRYDNPQITNMRDLPISYYQKLEMGVSSGFPSLDKLLLGLRQGEVTVISAETGAGKTTFSCNVMKNIADQGYGILINSYEISPETINRKMASLVLKKLMKFDTFTQEDIDNYHSWLSRTNCNINTSNCNISLQTLDKQLEAASLIYNIKYVLIDHLDYITVAGSKQSKLDNIDDTVKRIHELAIKYNLGILLVVHPKQVDNKIEITMNCLKGSSAIKQYADNIIILTRKSRDINTDQVMLKIHKNRLVGTEGAFFLKYLPEIDGYKEN